jgi:hypothetical protein
MIGCGLRDHHCAIRHESELSGHGAKVGRFGIFTSHEPSLVQSAERLRREGGAPCVLHERDLLRTRCEVRAAIERIDARRILEPEPLQEP